MINGKFFVLMLIVFPAAIAQSTYCNLDLCKYSGGEHIRCLNPSAQFAPNCKKPRIVSITREIRELILDTHNMYRNKIASGFHHFPRAVRMAYMLWSNDLGYSALLNVKQCIMKHDDCHNTKKFPNSGQNLAMYISGNRNPNVTHVVVSALQDWFNEYKDCPADVIDKLYVPSNGKQILHFTAIVQERNTHVGCAILISETEDKRVQVIIACNYAYTNMLNRPVYRKA